MANSWFKCKLFEIRQDRCAHKVGTDSFLLGAWANVENATKILDVGTGTGILSLMCAQRSKANITAIEIDGESVKQAQDNFNNSPWPDRFKLFHTSIQRFIHYREYYDVIICNPPYFINSLQNPDRRKAMARHAHTMSTRNILDFAQRHLKKKGHISLILPIDILQYFIDLLIVEKWHIYRLTKVYPNPSKPAHRILVEFGKEKKGFIYDELTIETNIRHVYTKQFYDLIKDFYLNVVYEKN